MRIRFQSPGGVLARWAREEDGVAATEYAILLSLLIIGSMGVIRSIGEKFAVLYQILADSLPQAL